LDKTLDIEALTGSPTNSAFNIYDNDISREYDTHSKENNSDEDISLIIRNIPLTSIEAIQSLVLYNRTGVDNNTTIGVAIELYNFTEDPDLNTILATTEVITTAENVYRFDFPSIDTYNVLGFSSGDSTTQIPNDTHSTKQVVSETTSTIEITGKVVLEGDLTAENLILGSTNVITALSGKANVGAFNNFLANQSITGDLLIKGTLLLDARNIGSTITSILNRLELLENP
jgi:hypothetical protein